MFGHLLTKKEEAAIWKFARGEDKVFSERFATDEILDLLEEEKFNREETLIDTLIIAGISPKFKKRPRPSSFVTFCKKHKLGIKFLRLMNNFTKFCEKYKLGRKFLKFMSRFKKQKKDEFFVFEPFTLFKVSILWLARSPFVSSSESEMTTLDLDIFFHILQHGFTENSIMEMCANAIGEVTRIGMTYEEAFEIAADIVKAGFRPMKMFPATIQQVKKSASFDDDWVTNVAACAHSVTGYTPDKIINELPISTAFHYLIQYCRAQGVKGIEKRTDEEILHAMSDRVDEIIADRLVELKVIDENSRENLINRLRTPPADEG